MTRFAHDFVQCPRCTHVWNRSFTYDAVPYQNNANRMFNSGGIWKGHLAETRDLLLDALPDEPTVIDIGCGEGHFVRGLAEARQKKGRFVGFDPNTASESGRGVEFHSRYFKPLEDMSEFKPDAITVRHVLEHLLDPAALLEQLAWGAQTAGKPCWLFAETPCIDRVFETDRLADFFFEHVSHFTTESFRTLLERAGEVVELSRGYDGEVVYGLVRLQVPESQVNQAASSLTFAERALSNRHNIREQLGALAGAGTSVAIWGGTGKAAAFIHQFQADADRFPIVVDSDPSKVGTHVPGTGQPIQSRDVLKERPVDTIIIPTQWRAKDIVAEIDREGICAERILIEHAGKLIDFRRDNHPYN